MRLGHGGVRWFTWIWIPIGLLVASLLGVAAWLLAMVLTGDNPLNEQEKEVWTFLGTALATVVTLIGVLLTAQHQARVADEERRAQRERAAHEAQALQDERQAKAARDALEAVQERRLQTETAAKMLEYLTIEDGRSYAQPAVVAGAVSTMMEVGGGPAGIVVLRELWADEAIPTPAAVGIVNRILKAADQSPAGSGGSTTDQDNNLRRPLEETEVYAAAELLALNAHTFLPTEDERVRTWINWPSIFDDEKTGDGHWPRALPLTARWALIVFLIRMLMSRSAAWWQQKGVNLPLETLYRAFSDDEEVAGVAGCLLSTLHQHCDFLTETNGESWDWTAEGRTSPQEHEERAKDCQVAPWFSRMIEQLEDWAETGAAVTEEWSDERPVGAGW